MRKYETIFIADPDLRDEQVRELAARVARAIDRQEGKLLGLEDWGVKKLAYKVRRQTKGHYVRVAFGGDGKTVAEVERQLKISEPVMKYTSARLSLTVTEDELAKALPIPEVGVALPGEAGTAAPAIPAASGVAAEAPGSPLSSGDMEDEEGEAEEAVEGESAGTREAEEAEEAEEEAEEEEGEAKG